MVLVASGVRDRRQKIEWVWVGVGDLNEDGVTGGIEYGFMSFTTTTTTNPRDRGGDHAEA